MYVDSSLLLCDGQDTYVTAAVSDNYVDLGVARDLGPGQQLYVICTVGTTLASSGKTATLAITLQTHEDKDFGTTVINVLTTQAYAESTLTAGRAPIIIPIPMEQGEQFLRLLFTIANESFTSGALDAFIGIGAQTNI